jgi:hypothetical protein
MRLINSLSALSMAAAVALAFSQAHAQTATNLIALKGLAPASALLNTPEGKAALVANLAITAKIQNGTSTLPSLEPFAQQQARALTDAVITGADGYELADGLGTRLGGAYQSLTKCSPPAKLAAKPAAMPKCTNITPQLATLIGYSSALTGADSNSGKYFFANETVVTKTSAAPVSPAAMAIMKSVDGRTDIFGKAYGKPAGSAGADPNGNSRPFQTEPVVTKYSEHPRITKATSLVPGRTLSPAPPIRAGIPPTAIRNRCCSPLWCRSGSRKW